MVRIYGASDDLVEIEGLAGMNTPWGGDSEEFNVYDAGASITFDLGPSRLMVEVEYGNDGWKFSLSQPDSADDNATLPFPVRIEQQHGYSLAVVVDCPPGTMITGGPDED